MDYWPALVHLHCIRLFGDSIRDRKEIQRDNDRTDTQWGRYRMNIMPWLNRAISKTHQKRSSYCQEAIDKQAIIQKLKDSIFSYHLRLQATCLQAHPTRPPSKHHKTTSMSINEAHSVRHSIRDSKKKGCILYSRAMLAVV